jgi:hypothetical protein
MNARVRETRLVAALLFTLLACSDSTAPTEGDFQVVASPETVPSTGPDAGIVRVTLRNNSSATVAIDWCNESLQEETSPGVWPSPAPATTACVATDVTAHSEQTLMRGLGTLRRRVRLVYPYWFVTYDRGSSSTPNRLIAYSNPVVVGP